MAKFATILGLYAAVMVTLLVAGVGPFARPAAGPSADGQAPRGSEDVRTVLAEARALLRTELKGTLKDVNWRFAEMDKLRQQLEDGLAAMQKASEDAAQANYGMLETMKEDLERFGKATADVETMVARLEALEKRLKAVEDRPAQIIRETILKEGGGPVAAKGSGPERRKLPTDGPTKDPAVVAQEVAKAREGLASNDLDTLFPAIEKIREHRVMDAVPRLIEILGGHKDEFGRMAAASALGDMQAADGVLPLADKAIRQITKHDTGLGAGAGIRRRRAARNKLKEWWRAHEAEVRAALGQPKAGS